MKKRLVMLVLAGTMLVTPGAVNGQCGPEQQDMLCGYACDTENGYCRWSQGVPPSTVCTHIPFSGFSSSTNSPCCTGGGLF